MVQPAASAGASLRVIIASGKFHGVTARTGPTGLRWVMMRLPPSGDTRYSPAIASAGDSSAGTLPALPRSRHAPAIASARDAYARGTPPPQPPSPGLRSGAGAR